MNKKLIWVILVCIVESISQIFINQRLEESIPSVEIRLKILPLMFIAIVVVYLIDILLISFVIKIFGKNETKIKDISDRIILPYAICFVISNALSTVLTHFTDELTVIKIPVYLAALVFCYVIKNILKAEVVSKHRLHIALGLILLRFILI